MGGARLLGVSLAATAVLLLAGPPTSRAADPPNPNDPCISGTRNVCGTTGVGSYKTYRYGTRWFGDFRNVVPGQFHMYCIDLRFWYPGPDYDYKEVPAAGLRNRANELIPVSNLQKIAYAIWTYGRTTDDNTAAAVMLYVHSLMGDARPGEVDPAAAGPAVSALYTRIGREAARYHGPYRVDVALPTAIGAGKTATATIRVLSAAGVPLPNLDLSLSATGASSVPSTARTNAVGVATVQVTATGAGGVHLTATTEPLPSTLPQIFRPSKPQAARNGQRLAAGASQRVSNTDTSAGRKAQVSMSTSATPGEVVSGGRSTDKVTLTGALPSYRQNVTVRLYGPFRTVAAIDCATKPVFVSTFQANGPGSYTTAAATLTQPGYYQYQEIAPSDANHLGFTTPCNAPTERVRVQAQPTVHTVVSAKSVAANGSVSDTVTVTGLWGEQVTVQAALYGPFPARNAIACSGTPVWTGTIQVTADGTYQTEAHALATPGYYTYYETIAAGEFVRAVKTPCADVAETTIVPGQPAVKTQVSAQQTKPGGTITDKVVVTGIGKLALPVQVALYGPFATRGAIACSGSPYWHGSFVARGDGTYTTAAVRIEKAGYYTYRETIAASEASPPDGDDVRRHGRDDLRARAAGGDDDHLQRGRPPRRGDLRPRPGQGSRQDRGQDPGRAVRPVRDPSGDRVHHAPPRVDRGHCPRRRCGENAAVPPGEDGVLHLPRAPGRIAAGLRVHHSVRGRRRDVAGAAGDRHRSRRRRPLRARPRRRERAHTRAARLPGDRRAGVGGRDRHPARCARSSALDPPHRLVEGRRRAGREVGVDPHHRPRRQRDGGRRCVLPSQGGKGRSPGHGHHGRRAHLRLPRRFRPRLPQAWPTDERVLAEGPAAARPRHVRRAVHRLRRATTATTSSWWPCPSS